MPWPDYPCPPGQDITTAADILDYIITKALTAMPPPPNQIQVITLATDCKGNVHPNPPSDSDHSRMVARAKFWADAGDWFRVADELNHGL